MSGRRIEKLGAANYKTIRFGQNLKPGLYVVSVVQGGQRQVLKVIKQ